MALARTLATKGTVGDFTDTFASASAITSAAGFIREQWKGADTGRSIARLAPFALALSTARSPPALFPETTTCPAPLWWPLGTPHLARRPPQLPTPHQILGRL